jgi:signal transduction histidine kinase
MKLLYKYSRINLLTSVVIFLLGSVAFYFFLHHVFMKQVDEELEEERQEVVTYAAKNNKLPEIIPSDDEITTYTITDTPFPQPAIITEKRLEGGEDETYRTITFSLAANNKKYNVAVAKSLEDTEAITLYVILISAVTIFILLISSFIINRILLKRLWRPFHKSMGMMKNYTIGQKPYPVFPHTDIEEFETLNKTLNESVSKSEKEFKSLKEFTENASHEMQTPVAVIRSKMDVLIQDEHLSESQSRSVQGAYDAINKLARLNHALLLLSKIENSQFSGKETLSLSALLNDKIEYFNEILQSKSLNISFNIEDVSVKMNAALADILLNNLFSNAIKHSAPGGKLYISSDKDRLVFSNGPADKPLDSSVVFKRFSKGGNSADEHGLGLAIVKEICAVSCFSINYSFDNNMHSFIVWLKDAA